MPDEQPVASASAAPITGRRVWRADLDEAVERAFHRLSSTAGPALVNEKIHDGGIILEEMYLGDIAAWESHGKKFHGLRRLSRRFAAEGQPRSPTTLWRAVAIYRLEQRFRISARTLTYSHYQAILGLAPDDQARLMDEAEAKGWSTRALIAEVAMVRASRAAGEKRRGRPATPRLWRAARRIIIDLKACRALANEEWDDEVVRQALEIMPMAREELALLELRLRGAQRR
jgi:hypothetical protein